MEPQKEASALDAEEAPSASANAQGHPSASKGRIHRVRNACILIVFLSIVVGLFLRFGWGTLSSLGVDAVAYVCPLGALETLLAGREIVPRLLIALACVVIVVALFGRFFCSWICVVPPVSRFFHPNGAKKKAKAVKAEDPAPATDAAAGAAAVEPVAAGASAHACSACGGCDVEGNGALAPVGGARDGFHLDTRHGVLAGALVSSLICGFPVFCLVCPIGISIALVIGVYSAIFEQNPTVSLLIFVGILLVELVFFRKWCHRICPVGAFMSLVGAKAPFAKPRVDEEACLRSQGIDCRVCVSVCPEELDPHSSRIPECTKCGKCVEKCPANAISMRRGKRASAHAASANSSPASPAN